MSAHNEAVESMDVAEYMVDEVDSEKPTSVINDDEQSSKTCEIEKLPALKGDKQSTEHQLTLQSKKKKDLMKRKKKKQHAQEEERERGRVSWHVYWSYMLGAYKGSLIPVIVVAQLLFQLLQISSNWWMAWASPPGDGHKSRSDNMKMILVYMGLAFASAVCVFLRAFFVSVFGLKASQKLFLSMTKSIFNAPMSFFDSTPTGRILNRVCASQMTSISIFLMLILYIRVCTSIDHWT